MMEPDDRGDDDSSLNLRPKLNFFKNFKKPEQSSQTKTDDRIWKRPHVLQSGFICFFVGIIFAAAGVLLHDNLHPKHICFVGIPVVTILIITYFYYWAKNDFASERTSGAQKTTTTSRFKADNGFSPKDMEVFQKPMCLVSTEEDNVLKIETEAVDQIAQIDWPIVIVSIAGLYRTGKSYLMNRLAGSTKGFTLGDTSESKTKGIWVWCQIHPEKTNTVLMLLDTEGLGAVDKGDRSHDNKIFTIATLLCNCLVYNIKNAFDQEAVDKLTFVTEMTKNIRFKGKFSDDNCSLTLILPDFVLCIRDFSLKLNIDGKTITEDEYLEQSLATQNNKDERFNKPKEFIRKYFQQRKCFTFPVPGDGDVIENLETLEFNALSDKFKEATLRFVGYVYTCQPKELLASKPINGQMFTTLATHYVTAIRHGAVPDVDDAFSAAAKIENCRVGKEAVEIFETQMETVTIPVPYRVLEINYTKAQEKTLNYLRTHVVHDKDGQCEREAQMKMDILWNKMKEENATQVQEMCDVSLQQAYKISMEEKIENREYEKAGGHKMFQRDIVKVKDDLMSTLRDFEEHEISWTWLGFLKTLQKNETKIIEADYAMSVKEKEDERKRNEENIKKIMKEHKKSQEEALEEQRKAMEEHMEKLNTEREEQHKIENAKFEELVKTKLEKEQAEKELMQLRQQQQERKNKWFFIRIKDAILNE